MLSEHEQFHSQNTLLRLFFCVDENGGIQWNRSPYMKSNNLLSIHPVQPKFPPLSLSLLGRCQDCSTTKLSHRSRQMVVSFSRARGHTKDKRSHPSPKPTQCELKSKHYPGSHGWLGACNTRLAGVATRLIWPSGSQGRRDVPAVTRGKHPPGHTIRVDL